MFLFGVLLHQSHSSTSLWRNLEWVTTGFSPSDTFQIFSTSQKLTRKSVQYLVFITLVFHVRTRVLLITNVSRAQSFGLGGCRFSCIRSIFFLPPCRNIFPCRHLPLAEGDTSLPAGHQPGEHVPSA